MKIGINALCVENRSGTGRYTAELLRALARIDNENKYCVLLPEESALNEELAGFPNFDLHLVRSGGTLRRCVFERFRLRSLVESWGLDLFHGPAFVLPAGLNIPSVVTVHDLVFHLFPETIPFSRRLHYWRTFPASIRRATRVLADSDNTARDLEAHFGVEPERISRIHLGVHPRFFQPVTAGEKGALRRDLRLPERFVLAMNTRNPRKNLLGLLRGYCEMARAEKGVPALVIGGDYDTAVWGRFQRECRSPELLSKIHFVGFVDDLLLPALYSLAEVFVHNSSYEGFGLPVLEAMAVGTAVIVANNSSIPEIVGDSAILLEENSATCLAESLGLLLQQPVKMHDLAVAGQSRARAFTWEHTAAQTLAAYESVFSSSFQRGKPSGRR